MIAGVGVGAIAAAVLLPLALLSGDGAATAPIPPAPPAVGRTPAATADPAAASAFPPQTPQVASHPSASDATALASLIPASLTGGDGGQRYELLSVGPFDRLAAAGATDTVLAEYQGAQPQTAGRLIAASFQDTATAQAFRRVLVATLVNDEHYAVLTEKDAPEIHGRFVGLSGPDGLSGLVWNNENVVALTTGEPQTSEDLFKALPF